LLPDGGNNGYVGVHLGAGFASKRLPVKTFAEVIEGLWKAYGALPVIVGGSEDTPLVKALAEHLESPILSLVGRLTILETAAVLERCRLFLGNDSAPMHLAAAVGTPVVAFFGPSEPEKYHPYGTEYRLLVADVPCRPCDHVNCLWGDYRCMQRFRWEDILQACEELWLNRSSDKGS